MGSHLGQEAPRGCRRCLKWRWGCVVCKRAERTLGVFLPQWLLGPLVLMTQCWALWNTGQCMRWRQELMLPKMATLGKVAALRGPSLHPHSTVSTRVGFLQLPTYSLPWGSLVKVVPALEVCLLTNRAAGFLCAKQLVTIIKPQHALGAGALHSNSLWLDSGLPGLLPAGPGPWPPA